MYLYRYFIDKIIIHEYVNEGLVERLRAGEDNIVAEGYLFEFER